MPVDVRVNEDADDGFLPDPMSALLDSLRMRCVATHKAVMDPGHFQVFKVTEPAFLCVIDGRCRVSIDDQPAPPLQRTELALVPRGTGRELRVHCDCDAPSSQNPPAQIIQGRLQYAGELPPILNLLPAVLAVNFPPTDSQLPMQLLRHVAAELQSERPGTTAVVNHLLTLVCLLAVRLELQQLPGEEPGWLQGLRSPDIGPILSLMLRHPERAWTIESLAMTGQMARSTFARRFRLVVGEAPMEVLTGIRMRAAVQLLQSEHGLKEIARLVGYRSVSAFSMAFRRWSGCSPWQYRSGLIEEQGDLAR